MVLQDHELLTEVSLRFQDLMISSCPHFLARTTVAKNAFGGAENLNLNLIDIISSQSKTITAPQGVRFVQCAYPSLLHVPQTLANFEYTEK